MKLEGTLFIKLIFSIKDKNKNLGGTPKIGQNPCIKSNTKANTVIYRVPKLTVTSLKVPTGIILA